MTKTMMPHFRSTQESLLINIPSMGGKVTFPTMSLYHSSKFAVEGFSESVSYELASQNIKVKLIEPGEMEKHPSYASPPDMVAKTIRINKMPHSFQYLLPPLYHYL
ncbi:SDR family NAD(P)-dependent oxidoreductase [Paenibacillus sp. F6_3S_P_1C]|uniref:SDR family NAD(P)-dependent oxidoreductase n=1 Tax=Paenibacillus vandeheii TaxID=3035917 RepID=A0ABT8J952_9BACL|nr:SDR family NAD(P)-dependent oxidoreductase [Paenibacillus vandeheii]MDN4601545.1 SDR family NAD(P)-dependent oxidoreductase [Paenibacillus vandeheii]